MPQRDTCRQQVDGPPGQHPTPTVFPRKQQGELPRLLLHGIDSLYVCHDLDLITSDIDFPALEFRKQTVVDRPDRALVQIGSEQFLMRPYGSMPYRYTLMNRDFTISLSEHNRPSTKIKFTSEALWNFGASELHQRIIRWAQSIYATIMQPETISRADFAFDFDLPIIDFDVDHFASRAKKDAQYREAGEVQTFTFGRGDTILRIYDKVAEIKQESEKTWFFKLWGQSENVRRVEYQVRGQRLKEGGIRNMLDLANHQGHLLRELATGHTTLRLPTGDQNKGRWPLHPLWHALLKAIDDMPQHGLSRDIDRRSPADYKLYRLSRSLHGNMKTVAALLQILDEDNAEPLTLDQTIAKLPELLRRHHEPSIWRQDVAYRVQDYKFGKKKK